MGFYIHYILCYNTLLFECKISFNHVVYGTSLEKNVVKAKYWWWRHTAIFVYNEKNLYTLSFPGHSLDFFSYYDMIRKWQSQTSWGISIFKDLMSCDWSRYSGLVFTVGKIIWKSKPSARFNSVGKIIGMSSHFL